MFSISSIDKLFEDQFVIFLSYQNSSDYGNIELDGMIKKIFFDCMT